MTNLKMIAALVAAAAAGTALGILIAPAKGSETRRRALANAKDLATNLNGKIREGIADAKLQQTVKDITVF